LSPDAVPAQHHRIYFLVGYFQVQTASIFVDAGEVLAQAVLS
jgi:hypothetical protein